MSQLIEILLDAIDRGDSAFLVLLDLSDTFDTVDHEILHSNICVALLAFATSPSTAWFRSDLTNRIQHVRIIGVNSDAVLCVSSVL